MSHFTTCNCKIVLQDIISAGSETTSTVLVWAMSELVKNPQLMHKAQSEVRTPSKDKTRELKVIWSS